MKKTILWLAIAALVIVAAVVLWKYKDNFSAAVDGGKTDGTNKESLPPVKTADAPPTTTGTTTTFKKTSGPGLAAIEKRVEEILNSDERESAFLESGLVSRTLLFKGLDTPYDIKVREAFDYANGTTNPNKVNWPVGAKWGAAKMWLSQIANWKNQIEADNWKNVKNLEISLDGLKQAVPTFPFILNRGDEIKFGMTFDNYGKKMDDAEFRASLGKLKVAIPALATRVFDTVTKLDAFLKEKAVSDLEKSGWVFA